MNKIIKYVLLALLIILIPFNNCEAISTKSARIIEGAVFFGSLASLASGFTLLAIKNNVGNYPFIREISGFGSIISALIIFKFTHDYIHTITPAGKFIKQVEDLNSDYKEILQLAENLKRYNSFSQLNEYKNHLSKIYEKIDKFYKSLEELNKNIEEIREDAKYYDDVKFNFQVALTKLWHYKQLSQTLNSLYDLNI